jgi:DNA-directed RNA polymerase I subunit RPA43
VTVGKVNLCSPDHISVLVHKVFNASIPRHHIPTDHWQFEYGPAENDPEFAPDTVTSPVNEDIEMVENAGEASNLDPVPAKDQGDETANDGGQWVHTLSSEKIGGSDGYLEFTVIG